METAINSKPSNPVQAKQLERWPRWKGILFFSGLAVLLIAWFGLGFYLHLQVEESRAKVEQNRLEEQRLKERERRSAQYQQDLQQRTKTPAKKRAVRQAFPQ